MRRLVTVWAALAALHSMPAAAVTEAEIAEAFGIADLNSDGYVNLDEYAAYMINFFASLDTNRDGFLSLEEVKDQKPERFDQVDSNGDNLISLGEGVGDKMTHFFDSDTNRDGVMTLAELLTYEAKIGELEPRN